MEGAGPGEVCTLNAEQVFLAPTKQNLTGADYIVWVLNT